MALEPAVLLEPELDDPPPPVPPSTLGWGALIAGVGFLLAAGAAALLVGPADLSPAQVLSEVVSRLPLVSLHPHLGATDAAVIWQIRMPRIVLGGLVGATLASAGAAYQGVFLNPLADPYLLGVAGGAGLGATVAVVAIHDPQAWPVNPVPLAAFCGAILAVAATFALGRSGTRGRSPASLLLSGVAVAAFFTALQTFLQQRDSSTLQQVYSWILGGLSTASWPQVELVLPYLGVSLAVLFCSRRLLDVMSVGDDEARSLGVAAGPLRALVIAAATLGTAAAVSVTGLIGFVGIIVPHGIRLFLGPSYRRIVPLSVLVGGGFLILADLAARSLLSPAEIPIGVVTAFFGAPFFLIVLNRSRRLS